jgi:hypothetical protein
MYIEILFEALAAIFVIGSIAAFIALLFIVDI